MMYLMWLITYIHIQAGLILYQGCVPDKHRTNWTHRIPIQSDVFPGGYGIDIIILYSVWQYHWWTCGPVKYICTVYTHFYTTDFFLSNAIKT